MLIAKKFFFLCLTLNTDGMVIVICYSPDVHSMSTFHYYLYQTVYVPYTKSLLRANPGPEKTIILELFYVGGLFEQFAPQAKKKLNTFNVHIIKILKSTLIGKLFIRKFIFL